MSLLKFMGPGKGQTKGVDEQLRQKQLLYFLSFELIILSLVLSSINLYLGNWLSTSLLAGIIILAAGNLALLHTKNWVDLCAHLLNGFFLLAISCGTVQPDGVALLTANWYFILPVIAALSIGLKGLFVYSLLSMAFIGLLVGGEFLSISPLATEYSTGQEFINIFFIFLFLFIHLHLLLTTKRDYEVWLKEQNFVLFADKQKFHYLSHHDSLTNLPNRSYFITQLQELMDTTDWEKNSLTLYYMDLDGFKAINDQHGHEVGDILLLQASKRLQSCFRKQDCVARIGGDEFVAVIQHNKKNKIADALEQRIVRTFQHAFIINSSTIHCTLSIGKASYPSQAQDIETLLQVADQAMYHNKNKKHQLHPLVL